MKLKNLVPVCTSYWEITLTTAGYRSVRICFILLTQSLICTEIDVQQRTFVLSWIYTIFKTNIEMWQTTDLFKNHSGKFSALTNIWPSSFCPHMDIYWYVPLCDALIEKYWQWDSGCHGYQPKLSTGQFEHSWGFREYGKLAKNIILTTDSERKRIETISVWFLSSKINVFRKFWFPLVNKPIFYAAFSLWLPFCLSAD